MTTITATAATAGTAPDQGNFRAWLRKVGAQLRRAFELSGTPYVDGAMPPL